MEYTVNNGGYSDDPDFRPYLTFYPVPEGTEIKGVVLICPGGAFLFRSDGPEGVSVAQALSERGYQSFVVDYRLRPYAFYGRLSVGTTDVELLRAGELPPTFLSHCKWECQYHIVFIPKYRKKVLYGKEREDVREIIRTLCRYKKGAFPSEDAGLKALYLRLTELYKKWANRPVPNWAMVRNQLSMDAGIQVRIMKYGKFAANLRLPKLITHFT